MAGFLSDNDVGIGQSAPAPLMSDADMGVAAPSRLGELASAVTDIPHKIYEAGASAVGGLNNAFNPYSEANTHKMERIKNSSFLGGLGEQAKGILDTGAGVMSIPAFVAAPATGTVRSVVGHTFNAANPMRPGMPGYQSGEDVADTAMMGIGARAGLPAPITAGPKPDSLVSRITQPFTESGQKTLAGRVLESRATDPNALRTALSATTNEIIPGSRPTTFQATGDMGLGSLEREIATKDPAAFMARRAEQNSARLDQLSDVQPTGNPQAVASAFRNQLGNIDAMTQTAVDDAVARAQTSATTIGGAQNQEVYGSQLRSILQSAENGARGRERALWNAVDPHGDLTMNMTPVQNAAQSVYGQLSQAAAATLKPIEQQVLSVVGQYKPVEPFRELTDLRSLVSSALREELSQSGRTPAYARLSQLRGGIEQSINNAVSNRAVADAANVASGQIAPEQSLAANIQRQIAEWQSGRNLESGVGEASANGPGTMSPVSRGQGPSPERPINAPGDQGVQVPNFDQAAAERLRAASEATKERAQIFGAEPLKGILRREGAAGPFRLKDTAVPNKIFHPGDTGFEDVNRFVAASGRENAMPVLRDYAASSLREAAMTPEGVVDPAKFARWQAQHSEALRAFPDLQSAFGDAAQASRSVSDANALRRSALQDAQEGVFGKLAGLTDHADIVKTVGGVFGGQDSVGEMRRIVAQVRKSPEAMKGLQKSVADYMTQKFISNTEAATSGRPLIKADQFQTFVKTNEAALSQVFSPEQMTLIKAVANDLQRANRSITAVKLPGQSNTAQDLSAIASKGGQSWLTKIAIDAGAALGGLAASSNPIVAAVAGGTAHVANAIRTAGFSRVDELVKQAILDPEFARALLVKAPVKPSPAGERITARRLLALSAAMGQTGKENK